MKKLYLITIAMLFLIVCNTFAQDKEKQREFVGAEKCKICHRTAMQGEQYRIWGESAHAKAYEVLASDNAKKYGAERKIKNPQTAPECLKCHITGYGVDEKYLVEKYAITEGVSCESCHGAGGDYSKLKTMKDIMTGEIDAASVGLVIPDEKVCVTCHNEESPAYKKFVFKERVKQIAHPIPAEKKATYKAK